MVGRTFRITKKKKKKIGKEYLLFPNVNFTIFLILKFIFDHFYL